MSTKIFTKEHGTVTIGFEKGANLGVTMFDTADRKMMTMQFDIKETANLVSYLGGKDLLCEQIKAYESLNKDSIDRMEVLRETIKDLIKTCEGLVNFATHSDVKLKANLVIERAKKELE